MLSVNSQTADSLKSSSLWVMGYRREIVPTLNPLQRKVDGGTRGQSQRGPIKEAVGYNSWPTKFPFSGVPRIILQNIKIHEKDSPNLLYPTILYNQLNPWLFLELFSLPSFGALLDFL